MLWAVDAVASPLLPLLLRYSCADLEVCHDLQRTHQRRMVPGLAAVRGAGVEQFLGGSGIRQRYADLAGVAERQVQILLMQLDPKAWVEGAVDHALTMDFEYA